MDKNSFSISPYIRRRGRITSAQQNALLKAQEYYFSPDFFKDEQIAQNTIKKNLQQNKEVVLDIGFGMGDSTAAFAEKNPHIHYWGVELYQAGIGALLLKIEEKNLKNISIFEIDVIKFIEYFIPDKVLSGVNVFFPDPWPKKKHQKRRLIQKSFLDLLVKKIKKGGYLHCATDIQDYAQQMNHCIADHEFFSVCLLEKNESPGSSFTSCRPSTRFEQKAILNSREIFDIVAVIMEEI